MYKQKPNPQEFVVRNAAHLDVGDLRRTLQKLDQSVEVETLATEKEAFLLHFHQQEEDPKVLWQRVRETVGTIRETVEASHLVSPVLDDARGEPHYPTGTVTVRFRSRQEEEKLESFAVKHDVTIFEQNKWVPEQIVLRPRQPENCYLPELIDKLAEEPEIFAAWADTESHYERTR